LFKNSYSCFKLDKLLEKKYTVDNADYLGSSKENHTIKKNILRLSHFFFLNIHVFCYLACFSLIPECEKCHENMNLRIIL
jgi:hypothetical protein